MKSETAVRLRLARLYKRYKDAYVKRSQDRRHDNCVHNYVHVPNPLQYKRQDVVTDLEISPRTVTTLLVIQEDSPVRICMYGSESPKDWPGDICDSPEVSRSCNMFKPKSSVSEASAEFDRLFSDDRHVYIHYPDVAALQWVVGDRSSARRPGAMSRLIMWLSDSGLRLRLWGRKQPPQPPSLPPAPSDDSDLNRLWSGPNDPV